MTDHAELSGSDLAKLTAIITGGGYKRSANRAAAEKRFISAAAEAGVGNAADLAKGPYDMAEHVIREKLAGKPLAIAEVKGMRTEAHDVSDTDLEAAAEFHDAVVANGGTNEGMGGKINEAETAVDRAFHDYLRTDHHSDEWMKALFQGVFEAGMRAAKPSHSKRERKPRTEGPTKREIAANLLRRPGGCTAKDILEATGWTAVSVPSIAKAASLTLRQEKVGRSTRYFGAA